MVIFGPWPPSWWAIGAAAVLTVAFALGAVFGVVVAIAFVVVVVILVIYARLSVD